MIPNLTTSTGPLEASQEFLTGKSGQSGQSDQSSQTLDGEVLDPERPPMTSDQFTEFWCFDLWSGMAMGSAMVPFLPDMSPIITPEEARPQAEKAGQALEKLTHKYKFLDWMRSPYIEESSDFMAIAMFFGVKVRIMATIAQAHRSGGSASPAGEASDLPDGLSDTKQSGATA